MWGIFGIIGERHNRNLETSKIKYQRRIIAFIDILGFKEIVKQSESNALKIELLYDVLSFLKDWETTEKWDLKFVEIEETAQKKGVAKFDLRGKTNSTSFSDSIVVSVLVDDDVNEMASTLIANLAYIGGFLLEKGILIRGGLTIGNLIHNESGTVFGQGLIDAFLLETKSAKYPRIVIGDKLLNELNYPIEAKYKSYPYHQYISRFDDGCIGFHQMIHYQVIDSWTEMTPQLQRVSLKKIRNTILNGLDLSFESPDIFEKYQWLKEQYNKLIILSDFDPESKTYENVKLEILDLDKYDVNIHYSFENNLLKPDSD